MISRKPAQILSLRLALASIAALAFIGMGVALWARQAGLLDSLDAATILVVCSLTGVAGLGLAITYTPGDIPPSPKLDRWEKAQKNRSLNLIAQVCLGPVFLSNWSPGAVELLAEGRVLMGVLNVAAVVVWVLSPAVILMGWSKPPREDRGFVDDELDREFRARALASGFITLLVSGAATYVASLLAPATTPHLLPVALWFGGAVACAHFIWLHHRAQPTAEDDG
ncbi:MAG: hypothetical protein EON96_08950 [Caulobacteraceae bacterium]|nr:MAG: hypothetical protein EON96_08950 [Caulobacteraceae bacterium]